MAAALAFFDDYALSSPPITPVAEAVLPVAMTMDKIATPIAGVGMKDSSASRPSL